MDVKFYNIDETAVEKYKPLYNNFFKDEDVILALNTNNFKKLYTMWANRTAKNNGVLTVLLEKSKINYLNYISLEFLINNYTIFTYFTDDFRCLSVKDFIFTENIDFNTLPRTFFMKGYIFNYDTTFPLHVHFNKSFSEINSDLGQNLIDYFDLQEQLNNHSIVLHFNK